MRVPTGFRFFTALLLAVEVPSWGGDLPSKCGAGLRSQRVDRFQPLRPTARRAAYRVALPVAVPGANVHLTEHFRVIQLYNTGGYRVCAEGEDGFCPGL